LRRNGRFENYMWVPVGEGENDMPHLIRTLAKAGYRRSLSVHLEAGPVGPEVTEELGPLEEIRWPNTVALTQAVAFLKGVQVGLEARLDACQPPPETKPWHPAPLH
jgi:sugar phosphate isomerase/epimerase